MKKTERYLARLAPHASTLTEGGAVHQIGAICYRTNEMGAVEVLLITTRASGRWTIPKGWPIKNLKPHQAAEREAWEEAGVAGKANKRALGYFTYLKTLDDGHKTASIVEVFRLKVDELHHKFPERGEREVAWLSPVEAARRVQEPELKGLLMRMLKEPSS
ncbi:NUDIX domain-containing protein [Sinorhizobium meliloti]|uniref:NUDIX hydrolase n=1 Tax=Rhizobium meliloti TaxID=382 RepID=UPI000FD8416E|nr:NUDIX hydrolase [Sinorhizobium meliloti]MCO6422316.1 NUDIX hydrolase [Sinorhizobium meliloti]MDW9628878.1 NUDIX domain-containing protein [Sinorhizobium meliloti]MDW9919653.1 NUDIX domain-containing protein [Sinorhizobium meliloti]MDX0030563.1 NUDIX domain-containing protein [Sinorhizobium meliloti]MDX0195217.1 NUDIX domain-containing protein [Sinorhizobium meliloti]